MSGAGAGSKWKCYLYSDSSFTFTYHGTVYGTNQHTQAHTSVQDWHCLQSKINKKSIEKMLK